MERYTKQQKRDVRKAKTLSEEDRKTYLSTLAEQWGKTERAVIQTYGRYMRKTKTKKKYVARRPRVISTTTAPVIEASPVKGHVVEIPFKEVEVDIARQRIRLILS